MTTELAERRKGRLLAIFLAAGALAAVAAITTAIDVRSSRPDLASGPVAPGLAETIGRAQRIIVVSEQASYSIEHTQQGWVMHDRGDFPVLASRLAQLTGGLEGLRYVRRMTSDPAKHTRLGVGDPAFGGQGVHIQIEDANLAPLVDLILGVQPSSDATLVYVRRTGQDQVWAAHGELPPFRDVTTWLDLKPLELAPGALARVEITPPEGRPYAMARSAPGAAFEIVAPARLAALAPGAVADVAERITRLEPVDVQTAPAIQGNPRARIRAITFDGVSIEGELIASDAKTWLKLVARADGAGAPEQAAAAQQINDRVSAWAYALSDFDANTLMTPLSHLLPGPPGPPS